MENLEMPVLGAVTLGNTASGKSSLCGYLNCLYCKLSGSKLDKGHFNHTYGELSCVMDVCYLDKVQRTTVNRKNLIINMEGICLYCRQ